MFSLRVTAAVVATSLVAVATTAAAQREETAPDSALRVIHRLDSLLAVRRAVADSVVRASSGRQGVRIAEGIFHLQAAPALETNAREAERLAHDQVAARGGATLRDRMARREPVIGMDSARALLGIERRLWLSSDTTNAARRIAFNLDLEGARVFAIAERLVSLAEAVAREGADSALSSWMMVQGIPLREPQPEEWRDARAELATVPSSVVERCLAHDWSSCLTSLGLDDDGRPLLERWYAPADYRGLVASVRLPSDSTAARAARNCIRTSDAVDCANAARTIPGSRLPLPVSASGRRLFVNEVLRAGGPGALDRLLTAHGPMRARIAVAAGMPPERVAERWVGRLESARPESVRVDPVLLGATLLWCGLFTVLGITRRGSWV